MSNNLDKVILGANPFEGVSYLSQEQRTYYREKFSKVDSVLEIMEVSLEFGVNTVSTGNNKNVLEAVRTLDEDDQDIKVIPVIPSVYEYVKKSSLNGMGGLLDFVTKYNKLKLTLKAPSLIKKGLSKDVIGLFSDLIDIELEGFKDFNMPVIILHGVTTDMAVSLNQIDLLSVFCDFIRDKYDAEPGIATHNFGKLMSLIQDNDLDVDIVLAPVNERGFMMNPSAEKCLDIIKGMDNTLIAKKILAGGVINPEDAFRYIFHDLGINNAMVGIAGLDEAYQTFRAAKKYL